MIVNNTFIQKSLKRFLKRKNMGGYTLSTLVAFLITGNIAIAQNLSTTSKTYLVETNNLEIQELEKDNNLEVLTWINSFISKTKFKGQTNLFNSDSTITNDYDTNFDETDEETNEFEVEEDEEIPNLNEYTIIWKEGSLVEYLKNNPSLLCVSKGGTCMFTLHYIC